MNLQRRYITRNLSWKKGSVFSGRNPPQTQPVGMYILNVNFYHVKQIIQNPTRYEINTLTNSNTPNQIAHGWAEDLPHLWDNHLLTDFFDCYDHRTTTTSDSYIIIRIEPSPHVYNIICKWRSLCLGNPWLLSDLCRLATSPYTRLVFRFLASVYQRRDPARQSSDCGLVSLTDLGQRCQCPIGVRSPRWELHVHIPIRGMCVCTVYDRCKYQWT